MAKRKLTNIHDKVIKLPSYNIHGFQQCCSAAILHGIGGYAQALSSLPPKDNVPMLRTLRDMDQKPCKTLEEYRERRSKKTLILSFPQHHAFCMILEGIYRKARYGNGGHNMYASPSYNTHTWFMADRRRDKGSISCMTFMNWLKELGPAKVGRIHISPYRPGAHGGECKGAVFSPNLKAIKPLLDEALKDMNDHAEWIFDHYNIEEEQTVQNKGDEVGNLW